MCKRLVLYLSALLLAATLGGCWNYRGLDQKDIVVGIAVDYDRDTKKYKLSYEIANLMGTQINGSINGRLVESQGETLFDAARNAKRTEADRLFFGNAQVVVISQELVREENILNILEWFLRDAECRETMYIALSQEDTAGAILERSEKTEGIISTDLHDILTEDSSVTSSSVCVKLYQVYNMLDSPGNSTLLPVLRKVKNAGKDAREINGSAVIKAGKLVGFLSPEQSKYALMIENSVKSGILTLSIADTQKKDVSLEIFKNSAKKSFEYKDDSVIVTIETDTNVALGESHISTQAMDAEQMESIQTAAERMIEENIKSLISLMQKEFHADVFGFGEMIYHQNLALWNQLAPLWEELFPTVEVQVSAKVQIVNSAFIK